MPASRSHPSFGALAVLLVVATGIASGCSPFRPPTITVIDAAVTERTDEAVRIEVALDLENLNNEPMELRRFTYRFDAADGPAFRGLRAGEATLGPEATRRMMLPAVVLLAEDAPLPDPLAWSIRGELVYTTPGALAEILLDTGVRTPTASFGGTGELVP